MRGSASSPADRLVTLPEGIPKLTLGFEVIRWAAKYLRQPNGANAGQQFQFVKSQVRFLLWWYAVNSSGEWLFHHGVRRLAKGSGKSPFAGVVALAELTANVRLKDFNPRVPGGCVGKPVGMPWVQIVATSEAQTKNTMRMVRAFAPKGSPLVQAFNLDPGKTQYYMSPEGTLEQITSSPTTAEGAESTFVVGDETEHWRPNNGGTELSRTLSDNLAKSGSRMMTTCNSWKPGLGSVAEADWDAWVAQEEGRTRSESKILYDARVAPPDTDLKDEASLLRALAHVYDDCYWAKPRPIITRIWDPRSSPEDSKRKYLNWPTADAATWATQQQWLLCKADPAKVVADGEEIVMFFDGSKSRDATALVGCRIDDGHVFEIGVWERPVEADGELKKNWSVPIGEVEKKLAHAFKTWTVLAFFADVREWESYVHTTWPQKHGEGLILWAQRAGKQPGPIAWDMRSHVMEFTRAAETCREEIEGRLFTHDGAAATSRHVVNARNSANQWGTSVSKESQDSPNKIDAAVCVIGARMVRRYLLASEEWKKRQKKKTSGRVVGWG